MSKFWDRLSQEHTQKLEEEGMRLFRVHIAQHYSASNFYDNAKWIAWGYTQCQLRGVTFPRSDSLIGHPFSIERDGKHITQDLINSRWEAYTLSTYLDLPSNPTICEIGSGSGRTAEQLILDNPFLEYTLCDVEPALSIAKWYLGECDISANVSFTSKLPKKQDIYLAISVFSELTPEEVCKYLKVVETGKYFYLKDWRKWENEDDQVEVTMEHYQIPKTWKPVYFLQDYPLYKGFFEGLWKIP